MVGVVCLTPSVPAEMGNRKEVWEKALYNLEEAYNRDSQDPKIAYHLALQYAHLRQIDQALIKVRASLNLFTGYSHSWNLLALLLSARQQYADALQVTKAALTHCFDVKYSFFLS